MNLPNLVKFYLRRRCRKNKADHSTGTRIQYRQHTTITAQHCRTTRFTTCTTGTATSPVTTVTTRLKTSHNAKTVVTKTATETTYTPTSTTMPGL